MLQTNRPPSQLFKTIFSYPIKRWKPLPSPDDLLPECGQHREGCKKWPRTLGSSVLEVQVIHFVREWLAEGSFLSFVIIRLLWHVSSWTPKPSAFGNSGWLGGCLNESDFVSALHRLLEHRIKTGRTTKQLSNNSSGDTSDWTCKCEPGDRE